MCGIPLCLARGMIIETGPAVHQQQPGQRMPGGIVPGQDAGQGGVLVTVGDFAGRYSHGCTMAES